MNIHKRSKNPVWFLSTRRIHIIMTFIYTSVVIYIYIYVISEQRMYVIYNELYLWLR